MQKNTESINPNVSATSIGKTMILSSMLYVVLKNQNLSENKKQKDYYVIKVLEHL